jgi:hypothetical protein
VTDASFCLSPLRAYMNVLNISFLFLLSLSSMVYGMRLYAHPPGGTRAHVSLVLMVAYAVAIAALRMGRPKLRKSVTFFA